ncbi:hypothetical protein [Cohnella mopanensis]|uniref:hypothetical protein n=1 Tax=Cohnella mopanensis TaxID=2911966 RepID=UPI001EF7E451|nr:hypothetical protein [Cohnella mopanensis]
MQIRYVRDPHTLSFIVSLPALGQKIAVLAPVMQRIVGVSPRAVLGSWSINTYQAAKLGFLVNGSHPVITADQSEVSERELILA